MVKFICCAFICLLGLIPGKRTHRPVETATIHTVKDITARHGDIGISQHVSLVATAVDAAANFDTFRMNSGTVISIIVFQIYGSVAA